VVSITVGNSNPNAGAGVALAKSANSVSPLSSLASATFDSYWRIAMASVASVALYVGFCSAGQQLTQLGSGGIWIRSTPHGATATSPTNETVRQEIPRGLKIAREVKIK
jgi:hypothetical protein